MLWDSFSPEYFSLAAYAPTGTLKILISRRQPDVSVRVGSSLALADPDLTGKLVTEWDVSHSSVHRLVGELAPGWNVEAIETIPSDALAEWFLDRSGSQLSIEIQLTRAVSQSHSVTVILTGRLQRFGLDEPISAGTLRMVHWAGARVTKHLLSFQSTEPFVAENVGELPVVPHDQISDSDRALLDVATDANRIFDLAHADKSAGLQLTRKHGNYSAEVELDAGYMNGELRSTWRVAARPTANPIDQLLIYSTAPLGDDVRWIEESTKTPVVAKRLPTSDPKRKDLPKTGELWQLSLSQPTGQPIEISIAGSLPHAQRMNLPLLALPEAVAQHGLAFLRGGLDSSPLVDNEGLVPIPPPVADSNNTPEELRAPIRAAFRYRPTECFDASRVPHLWIELPAENAAAPLIISYLRLESFIWPSGRASHRATYELQNLGAKEFDPPLPTDAQVTSVFVNGHSINAPIPGNAIQLPQAQTSSEPQSIDVAIYFETHQSRLSATSTVAAPLLEGGVPVLAGEWTAWLPEEFTVKNASQAVFGNFNWRERLFGPLARPKPSPPFRPLQAADWAHLVDGILGRKETIRQTSPLRSASPLPLISTRGAPQPFPRTKRPQRFPLRRWRLVLAMLQTNQATNFRAGISSSSHSWRLAHRIPSSFFIQQSFPPGQ